METVDEVEYDVPEWAVVPLEYGDLSGLTDEDVRILDAWKASLRRDGLVWGITFTSDVNGFNAHPAFGKACATVRATVYYERRTA